MLNKIIGPIIAALTSLFGGFILIATFVYFGADGGASGQAAVARMTNQSVGLATAVIKGVVTLAGAIFNAALGAI